MVWNDDRLGDDGGQKVRAEVIGRTTVSYAVVSERELPNARLCTVPSDRMHDLTQILHVQLHAVPAEQVCVVLHRAVDNLAVVSAHQRELESSGHIKRRYFGPVDSGLGDRHRCRRIEVEARLHERFPVIRTLDSHLGYQRCQRHVLAVKHLDEFVTDAADNVVDSRRMVDRAPHDAGCREWTDHILNLGTGPSGCRHRYRNIIRARKPVDQDLECTQQHAWKARTFRLRHILQAIEIFTVDPEAERVAAASSRTPRIVQGQIEEAGVATQA